MLPHDKHTCTFRIVYTLYVCNKRINTQLQSMWILNKPWWKEQNIGIPECGRERCGKIFDYASSKIFATSPFASKIFASPTLCVYPLLSLRRPQDDANNSRTRPVWILISPSIELSGVKNVTPDWVYTILAMISKRFMAPGFFDQRRKNLDQSLFENWF